MPISVKPGGCEEYAHIPCNKPATTLIGWPDRGEGPYRMCDACAWHNIKNRNAEDLGPYTRTKEKP